MRPGHRTGPPTGHLTGRPTGVPIVPPTGLLPQHGPLQGSRIASLQGSPLLTVDQDQTFPDQVGPVAAAGEEEVAVASGAAGAEEDS